MAQDLRKLLQEEKTKRQGKPLAAGHEARFFNRLEQQMQQQKQSKPNKAFMLWKIAAILVVALACTFFVYQQMGNTTSNAVVNTPSPTPEEPVYLSDVSPEFKQLEDFYLANINAELAQLKITPENKELIDSFMMQLETLDQEYKNLNTELKDTGINEQTVSALINNLELRLELLYKLKNKLAEIKKASLSETQRNNA